MLTKQQSLNLAIVVKENMPSVDEIGLTGELDSPINLLRDNEGNLLDIPDTDTLAQWCDAWQAEQEAMPTPLSDAERIAQLEAQIAQLMTLLGGG
jgi:hypothetical protein